LIFFGEVLELAIAVGAIMIVLDLYDRWKEKRKADRVDDVDQGR